MYRPTMPGSFAKNKMKKTTIWLIVALYLFLFLLVISTSIGAFYIFQPFKFIDNSKSYLLCQNNNKFFIGPNLVFTFTGLLDSYNDKKARKLCEYGLIRDYADTLKTPPAVNYDFTPVYSQESSWSNAAFAFFLAFSLGAILIKSTFKTVSHLFLARKQRLQFTLIIFFSIMAGVILFNSFLKKPAAQIFCQKKVNTMILNFKLSINFTAQSEEEKYVDGFTKQLYNQCLKKEL